MNTQNKIQIPHVSTSNILDLIPGLNKQRADWLEYLMTRKGQFLAVSWSRFLKTRKGIPGVFVKKVSTVARAGISYDNIAAVQEKRETGELPPENQGLPWGEWLTYPYLITHNHKFYVRLYPSKAPNHQTIARYFINGTEVTKEEVEPMCLASEFRDKTGDCYTVSLDNVVSAVPISSADRL